MDIGGFIPDLSGFGKFFLIFGWLAIGGGIVYLFWWLFAYNTKVIIHNPIARRPATLDKARLSRTKDDKSIKKVVLLKNKHDFIGTVPENHLQAVLGLFSRVKYQIHMVRDRHGLLYSIPPPSEEGFYLDTGIPPALREWTKIKAREAAHRYTQNSVWLQYGPLLLGIGGFLIVGVIMLVISRDLGTVAEAFNAAAVAFKESSAAQAAGQVVT